jgi:adhesin transport system outer membrane protein
VTNNPEVLAKWHALKAAQQEKKVAKSVNYPRLDLSSRIGYQKQNSDIGNASFKPREASLELTQLLFDGFKSRNDILKFNHLSLVRYFELLEISETIALEATRAYLDVLKFRELLVLSTENYRQHLTVYSQVAERVSAGIGRGVDLQQASGRLALAESNRITEATNLHDVSTRYLRIVGEPPARILDDPGQIAKVLPDNIDDALRIAFTRNPGFNAAMQNLKATEYDRKARKGGYLPHLEFRARQDIGYDRNSIGGDSRESTVELAMNYNLFRGGGDTATIRQFASRREVAFEQKNKVCRDIRQTLDIAYNDVYRLDLQLKQLDKHQESIANAREAYRKQFDIGQRSLLDLLDTENEYFQAKRTYSAALFDYQLARARTEASIGNLLASLDVKQDIYNPLEPLDGLNPDKIDPDAICPPIGIPLTGLEEIVFTPPPSIPLPEPAKIIPPPREDIYIYFGRRQTDITPAEADKLAEIAKQLGERPDTLAYLSGHASSRGTSGINIRLSRDRARAIRDRLIEEYNINPSRIVITWHSSRKPAGDNATDEGKSKNRRVVAHIVTAREHSDELERQSQTANQ